MNLPQIKTTCRDVVLDLGAYDALVFSSKNGVRAMDGISKKWREIPSYAIGKQTAKEIQSLDGDVAFTSSSAYGDEFAGELVELLRGKRVLFLRAKTILSCVEEILRSEGIDVVSEVIYETTCRDKTDISISKNSVLIFTSPSTINCFFENYEWDESFQAVCIGTTTAKAMPKLIPLHVSKTQTIEGCVELAESLINYKL